MKIIQRILKIVDWITHFITVEVWRLRLEEYPKHIAESLKYLRVFLVSFRRFNEDNVQSRASSLTYYSLLALVPILAMGFGIAKGFGFDKDLEQRLVDNFMGQEEVLNWIISFAHNMLDNTQGGLLAGVGLAVLFWSVMKMMWNIENAFNYIWQIKKGRSYVRQFTDYFSVMLIAPVFIFLASSGQVFVATQLDQFVSGIELVNLRPAVILLMKSIPYVLTWLLFTVLYIVMPNTKVNFTSALIAGILAGTAFLVVQWFYIVAQMGMSRYNVIYGSFAALPLLLFWLRASWIIVLLGAEVSFAKQNVDQYEMESESMHISTYANRAYSILLLGKIVRLFVDGEKPLTTQDMATQMKLPIRLVRSVITNLVVSELVSEVCTAKEKVHAYAPSKDVRLYTIKYVIETLDKNGVNRIMQAPTNELNKVLLIQENLLKTIENSQDNILLQELYKQIKEENNGE